MTQLSVNVNKIALLRNARSEELNIPDLLEASRAIIEAGCYGITVHPRPDERHIKYADAYSISEMLRGEYAGVEYNIEGNPFTGKYMELVYELAPDQATLVPDVVGANTSDHGWDLNDANCERLAPVIEKLKKAGVRVSIFVDADASVMSRAKQIGADRIELYTEPFARAYREGDGLEEMVGKYATAAAAAETVGLEVNAGHDLNLENLGYFIGKVVPVAEVSIGHALVAESLYEGFAVVVKKYLTILSNTL